jgi:hypothetical protein
MAQIKVLGPAGVVYDGTPLDPRTASYVVNDTYDNYIQARSEVAAGLIEITEAFSASLNSIFYVDTNSGDDTNDGLSWGTAFKTMSQAFDSIASGSTIYFRGKVKEQLVTPAGVFDVTVIGAGNRPRHADTTDPSGGELSANSWTEPDTEVAGQALVRVWHQGWKFKNILFYSGDDNACIELWRTAEGTNERDASHLEVIDCRFASGYNGIKDLGGCYGVLIKGCRFGAFTNYCILGVGNIGGGQGQWTIEDNRFYGFTNGVKIAAYDCHIKLNTFTDGGTPNTTVVLNTAEASGSGNGNNFVVDNYFQTATANFNTPDIVGNATDVWNNTSIDGTANMIGREVGQPA